MVIHFILYKKIISIHTKRSCITDSFIVSPESAVCEERERRVILCFGVVKESGDGISRWLRCVCFIDHNINGLKMKRHVTSLQTLWGWKNYKDTVRTFKGRILIGPKFHPDSVSNSGYFIRVQIWTFITVIGAQSSGQKGLKILGWDPFLAQLIIVYLALCLEWPLITVSGFKPTSKYLKYRV